MSTRCFTGADAGLGDDLGPSLQLAAHHRRHFFRRAAARLAAHLFQPRLTAATCKALCVSACRRSTIGAACRRAPSSRPRSSRRSRRRPVPPPWAPPASRASGCAPVMASARSLPALMLASTAVGGAIMSGISPPSSAVTEAESPRYGTCSILTPAIFDQQLAGQMVGRADTRGAVRRRSRGAAAAAASSIGQADCNFESASSPPEERKERDGRDHLETVHRLVRQLVVERPGHRVAAGGQQQRVAIGPARATVAEARCRRRRRRPRRPRAGPTPWTSRCRRRARSCRRCRRRRSLGVLIGRSGTTLRRERAGQQAAASRCGRNVGVASVCLLGESSLAGARQS